MQSTREIGKISKILGWAYGLNRSSELTDCANTDRNEDDLWGEFIRRMNDSSFDDVKALLVGFSELDLHRMRTHLRSIGVNLIASTPSLRCSEASSPVENIFTHVLINFDAFEDTEAGVETLLTLRGKNTNAVTILCSKVVSSDDFDSSRILICDATLKMPLTDKRLRNGFIAANANNREWRHLLTEG
ncbi:hypothetical protein [Roseinatronobacter sp. NSM]|uniref:hypothetical protein n=1 Tax=Roseinatronobacter sp. NSM TaxID=3457785 RepID=UPI0040361ED3